MKEFYFNNWIYTLQEEGDVTTFGVGCNSPIQPPDFLSKYCSLSEYSIDMLKNRQFYAAQPDDFNDIFDSSYFLIDFDSMTLEQMLKIPNKYDRKEEQLVIAKWKNNKYEVIDLLQLKFYYSSLSRMGILSMTPNKYDEIMWGYYTNHKGFLVEFDYTLFSKYFLGPFPVNYVPNLPHLDFNKLGNRFSFFMQTMVKKDRWRHENEHRFLLIPPSGDKFQVKGSFNIPELSTMSIPRLVDYPKVSIREIILGFRFLEGERVTVYSEYLFRIIFISNYAKIKNELFEIIVNNNYSCRSIIQKIPKFVLSSEIWNINKITNYEFEVERIKTNPIM